MKIEVIVTGVRNSINAGIGNFVDDRFVIGLDGDADVVMLGINNCLRVVMVASLRVL